MDKIVFDLLNEICPDFSEYRFLKTDLYKGKIISAHNIYYKKGEDDKEGIVVGKRDIELFGLEIFPWNFVTYNKLDLSDAQYGWTDEVMIDVLKHIAEKIKE